MKNNILNLAIVLTVGVILAGSLLMPVISDAQQNANPATLTNDTSIVLRETKSGDVLKCTSVYDTDTSTRTDTWTLNDETITALSGSAAAWNVGIMSDGFYLQINSSSNAAIGSYSVFENNPNGSSTTITGSTSGTATFTFTFGDENITYAVGNSTIGTYAYTWGYVICPYDEGEYCAAVSGGVGYVSEASDVVLCGRYTSGELDTMYYYKDGTTYVSNTEYTMTADIKLELTSGYTDIYTATVSVDMTDGTDTETFTPYRILLPYEVEGHAASGAAYSLYGAIPVIVIAAIAVASIGMVVTRRD